MSPSLSPQGEEKIMQDNLHVSIIQSSLYWENIDKNLKQFSQKISQLTKPADVIILPEMFTTGFSMNTVALAESMDGKGVAWMRQKTKEKNCCVVGSLIIKENNNYYNRLVWAYPDGSLVHYDKRHLFRMANEQQHYSPGNKKIIVEYKGWKICPLVCYDLRFPVWSRNVKNEYDLLIYIANWPERRSHAWKSLLVARAIENFSYVAGVNRVGKDGNDVSYSGDSIVINYKGEPFNTAKVNEENAETISISHKELTEFRNSFPAFMDADIFRIS